mmetsp:Transcript_22260/g.55127  ORF Transcript_22260/g.55127 Transcript_22260/m.55127 type:complete len:222 (+) Transcript_22260:2168-2833(+)
MSDFPPAPMQERTRVLVVMHFARRAALVGTSSMQSMIMSHVCSSGSASSPGPDSAVYISLKASTLDASSPSSRQVALTASTLGIPTSLSVAQACRLRLERVTWSKSMRRKKPTPPRANMIAVCDPTPPRPTTQTLAPSMDFIPLVPKYNSCRESCSFRRASGTVFEEDNCFGDLKVLLWFCVRSMIQRTKSAQVAPARNVVAVVAAVDDDGIVDVSVCVLL